jgi:hypothetical protein
LPWLIYAHPFGQANVVGGEDYFSKAWRYLLEFHFHFLPLCFLLLPLFGLISAHKDRPATGADASQPWEQFVLVLLSSYFVIIVIAPGFYLRYLLPLLPIVCLLAAAWVFRYIKWHALAILVVAIQSMSNVFSILTAFPFRGTHTLRFPVMEYAQGIATPYTDRFADILDFFKMQAHPGERVLTFDPEFPLIFYTPLGIIDGRMMAPPAGQLPDWILPSPASGVAAQAAVALPEFLKPHYEAITLSTHDSKLADNFPEPDFYQYKSAQTHAPFIIYELKPGEKRSQQ